MVVNSDIQNQSDFENVDPVDSVDLFLLWAPSIIAGAMGTEVNKHMKPLPLRAHNILRENRPLRKLDACYKAC